MNVLMLGSVRKVCCNIQNKVLGLSSVHLIHTLFMNDSDVILLFTNLRSHRDRGGQWWGSGHKSMGLSYSRLVTRGCPYVCVILRWGMVTIQAGGGGILG